MRDPRKTKLRFYCINKLKKLSLTQFLLTEKASTNTFKGKIFMQNGFTDMNISQNYKDDLII